MSSEKAGRNTKGTWLILQYGLCTGTFLIVMLLFFMGGFTDEQTDINFARRAVKTPPDLTSQQSVDLSERWQVIADKSILLAAVKWVFLSLLFGLLAAFIVWLSLICAMFLWWFVLDRIRDLSSAIRDQTK